MNAEFGARGIRVPEQVLTIGYGDYTADQDMSPGLTTFRVRSVEVGHEAVRLLDGRIREPEHPHAPMRVQVADVLVERHSVGPVNRD